MARSSRGQPKRKRGAARMKEFGYKLVTIWLDPEEMSNVRLLADSKGWRVAPFVRQTLLVAVNKQLNINKES